MLNILVTAGGTKAPIDDVRHIANFSTGRFGAAISEAWLERGAKVWHVAPREADLPFWRMAGYDLNTGSFSDEADRLRNLQDRWLACRDRLCLERLSRGTFEEYSTKVEHLLKTESIDAVFLAAAVSDYQPIYQSGKIRSNADRLVVECEPLPKVIQLVKDWNPRVYLVGFKLLSGSSRQELIETAERAAQTNRADLTVANDLEEIRAGRHTIHLVRPGQPVETFGSGEPIAERLVDRVLVWLGERG